MRDSERETRLKKHASGTHSRARDNDGHEDYESWTGQVHGSSLCLLLKDIRSKKVPVT